MVNLTNTKTIVGLVVAVAAAGVAYGIKTASKDRTQNTSDSDVKEKVTCAGSKIHDLVKDALAKRPEAIDEVRNSLCAAAKSLKSCARRCAHCAMNDTFKPCCKEGKVCKRDKQEAAAKESAAKDAGVAVDEEKLEELAKDLPEPVKAEDVVEAQEEAEALAAQLRNDVAKAEERAAVADTKKKRSPRVAKDNAKPVSVKESDKESDAVKLGEIELEDLLDKPEDSTKNEDSPEKSEEK